MERPIKGGYILISLGLVALSAGASLTVDYERITKTKKHIVLTGIKVADTIMPDVTVKPIFGNGTITFSDVYGYDIVVSSNGSAVVSEHEIEDIPNVEEAPSGTIVDMLGLNANGKVVKGVANLKLFVHKFVASDLTWEFSIVSKSQTPILTGETIASLDYICVHNQLKGNAQYYDNKGIILQVFAMMGSTSFKVDYINVTQLTTLAIGTLDINSTNYTETVTEL